MIKVHVELAGIKKEDVKISVNEENVMTIKGHRKVRDEHKDKNFLRKEIKYGEFSRSFLLPDEVQSENIKAVFTDGVLDITVPKKEPVKPKEQHVEIH